MWEDVQSPCPRASLISTVAEGSDLLYEVVQETLVLVGSVQILTPLTGESHREGEVRPQADGLHTQIQVMAGTGFTLTPPSPVKQEGIDTNPVEFGMTEL